MIYQNTRGMTLEIREHGCYFMSLINLAIRYTQQTITPMEIVARFREFKNAGYIGTDSYIINPEMILKKMGFSAEYVGKFPAGYNTKPNQAEILLFRNGEIDHFVVGDGKGHVSYDPWAPHSQTATYGELIGKRIFNIP